MQHEPVLRNPPPPAYQPRPNPSQLEAAQPPAYQFPAAHAINPLFSNYRPDGKQSPTGEVPDLPSWKRVARREQRERRIEALIRKWPPSKTKALIIVIGLLVVLLMIAIHGIQTKV
jgi:hypothetical protein